MSRLKENILNKNLKLTYILNTILQFNAHIGNPIKYVYLFAKKEILGVRNNLTIINLKSFLYTIKHLFFILKILNDFNPKSKVSIVLNHNQLFYLYIYKLFFKKSQFNKINNHDKFIIYFGSWIGGTFTNFKKVKILKNIPSLIFANTIIKNRDLLRESRNLKIPIVGLSDNNINLNILSYFILFNTSSTKTVFLIVSLIEKFLNQIVTKEKFTFFGKVKYNLKFEKRNKKLKNNEFSKKKRRLGLYEIYNEKKKPTDYDSLNGIKSKRLSPKNNFKKFY